MGRHRPSSLVRRAHALGEVMLGEVLAARDVALRTHHEALEARAEGVEARDRLEAIVGGDPWATPEGGAR